MDLDDSSSIFNDSDMETSWENPPSQAPYKRTPSIRRTRVLSAHAHMSIVLTFILGTVLAVGQHLFFSRVDGHVVTSVPVSEFWVRNTGSTLAMMSVAALTASTTSVFTQLLWYFVRRRFFTLENLDVLFDGPSNWALPKVLLARMPAAPMTSFFTIIACVQGLGLVSVFSPNTLSIVTSLPQNRSIAVQNLDLNLANPSSGMTNISSLSYLFAKAWTDGTTMFFPPSGCGLVCQYQISYQAPALVCTEVPYDAISNGNLDTLSSSTQIILNQTSGTMFNATWNKPAVFPEHYYWWGFTLAYATEIVAYYSNSTNWTAVYPSALFNATAIDCWMQYAHYQTNISFNSTDSSHIVTPKVVSYDGPLDVNNQTWAPEGITNIPAYTTNARVVFDALFGQISGATCVTTMLEATYPPGCVGSNVWTTTLLNMTSSISDDNSVYTYHNSLGLPGNLSNAIQYLFGVTTLAYIPEYNTVSLVNALVQSAEPVYAYSPRTLFLVYGLALLSTFLCAVVGLLCLHANGAPGSMGFSQILVTTRGLDLDRLAEGSESGKAYLSKAEMHTKLRFEDTRARPGFSVLSSAEDSDLDKLIG